MKKPDQAPPEPAAADDIVRAEAERKDRKAKRAPEPQAIGGVGPNLTRNAPVPAQTEERRLPQVDSRGALEISLRSQSYDATARTVEAVLSAGTRVRRYWINEELEISAEAIDLNRVTGGICPLLDTHNQYEISAQLGRIIATRIENAQLIGTIAFDETDRAMETEQRVARGELRAISIGYQVTRWQMVEVDENERETWRAVAWELLEASLVPVPADPNAVVRSAPRAIPHGNSQEEEDMRRNLPGGAAAAAPAIVTAPAIVEPVQRSETAAPAVVAVVGAAPAIPASRIMELCGRTAELGSEFAVELVRESEAGTLTEATMQERIADRLIAARAAPPIDVRGGRAMTDDEGYRGAVEAAVLLAANPGIRAVEDLGLTEQQVSDAREFRGMTLMEMSRDFVSRRGQRANGMGKIEIASEALGLRAGAHTTSDFANALGNAVNRRVRRAFASAPQTFRPFVSVGTVPDFRPASIIGLGDAPALLLVKENGEFKRGPLNDTGDTYQLATYGRVIGISRQAIINDDKSLFGRIPILFGNKAADLESDAVYAQLTGNPTMYDGVALFHASHGNLQTGAAIAVASVGLMEQAMLTQSSDQGGYLNIRPRFLICGPAKKVEAQQFLSPLNANTQGNINPYAGALELIVDPRITGNQWFLAADPNAFDTVLLAHLEGQEEVFTESRTNFDVDSVDIKARLDAVAKTIDWRGLQKNPGN